MKLSLHNLCYLGALSARQLTETSRAQRSREQWAACFPRYPVDARGFAHAFGLDDVAGYRGALARYGCAVVQVFSPAQCERSVEAMFAEINAAAALVGAPAAIDPEDPQTWASANWPGQSKFLLDDPALSRQAFANRVDPALHALFAQLWGEERLQVSVDNWGVLRGSGVPGAGPRWGRGLRPHWDYNPWLFVDELEQGREPGWQGLLALRDQSEEMGAHLSLPGGAPYLRQWCRELPCPPRLGRKRRSHRPPEDDPIREWMQPLPLRQGHLLLWSWGQLHGGLDNRSSALRVHQYVRMYPAPEVDPFYAAHDRYAAQRVRRRTPAAAECGGLELDRRARRLLGLEPW